MKIKINIWSQKQSGYWKGSWLRKLIVATLAIGSILGMSGPGWAAEPTFVGILAFLDDPEVANQLALSDQQRQKLTALLESREAEALELALQLRNLSPGERAERLLPFRQESERRGLALLTPEQQKKLQQIRLQKLGLASLAEEDVAAWLKLTEQQKAEVAKILRERADRLAVTSKERAHIVRAETERQLAQLLSSEQKSRWEAMLTSSPPQASPPNEPAGTPESKIPASSSAEETAPRMASNSESEASKPASEPSKPEPASPRKLESASGKMGGEQSPIEPPGKLQLPKPESVPAKAESATEKAEPVQPTLGPTEPAKPLELPKPGELPPAKPGEIPGAAKVGEAPSAQAASKPEPLTQPKQLPKSEPVSQPAEVPQSAGVPSSDQLPKPSEEPKSVDLAPQAPTKVDLAPESSTQPEPKASEVPSAEPTKPDSIPLVPLDQVKLRFHFRYQPWKDVLEWFAQQAGLSLIMDDPPKGTFNYTDDKAYTPAEAIDLLNGVLQTKGYVLVRRNRMLMVINLENGIPPLLIDTIPVEQLDQRGAYEVVSVLFQLQKLAPEEIEPEVQRMIGPQGSVISLPKSRQLLVTETVGRLRAIRRAIERAEDPEGVHRQHQLRQVALQYASPQEVLPVLRQFLDIPADQAAAPDGSIRVVPDPTGKALLVSGKEEKLNRLMEVLKFLDVPENAAKSQLDQTPQLEVYSVTPADPNSVLAVIQTLLAGSPDARVAIDPKTGNLIALCKPTEHATIRATLEQMQADPRTIEVIPLSKVDPQTAATSLKKLFGIGDTPDPNKPQIEVDSTAKQLLVRATQSQLEQIKLLLEKMGETGEAGLQTSQGGNVRMVPLTGRTAQDALDRALEIWPTMYKNRIRVVRPSAVIPTMRPSSTEEESNRPGSTGAGAASGSSASGPMETPEALLEQLFGPWGLPDSGTPSSGGALRTRIIRPPDGAGPAAGGPPSGTPPAGGPASPVPPGSRPGGTVPKGPFPPGQAPPNPPGAASAGAEGWHPAGTPPGGSVGNPAMPGGAVGNPSMPPTGPAKPDSNPSGRGEKHDSGETPPLSLPKPTREKTAEQFRSFVSPTRIPIFLASYAAPSGAEEEKSAGEASSSPPKQSASVSEQPVASPPAEKPIAQTPLSDQPVPEKPANVPTVLKSSEPLPGQPVPGGSSSPPGLVDDAGEGMGGPSRGEKPAESGSSSSGSSRGATAGSSAGGTPGTPSRAAEEPPVIVVAPGPGGIMIASEDLEALDAFENLLNSIASNLPESNVTVFYLKYAKAEAVADLLERIFGASSASSGGGPPIGGGRGLLGDIAGAALGDAGGGILGALLGLGGPGGPTPGAFTPTGTIQITPDPRLNALIVQANPKDTEMIEELLKILDQEKGPEPVAVQPKARVIPVINTAAEDIAELLREVYTDRLIGGAGAGQRPPTPQEFIQMLRGGGGGRAGGRGSTQLDIQQKMAIGVDTRNNAIIVVAPDQLFQEVEQLVKQLDAAAAESNQTIRVVNLRNANPAAVQQALSALMGSNVQFGRTTAASRSRQPQGQPGQQQPSAQMQMPFTMPGAQGFQGFGGQFRQFQGLQGQFSGQRGSTTFRGGGTSRQGRSGR